MSILKLLDEKIMIYFEKTETIPNKILMSQETKDKIFEELELTLEMDRSWKENKDNYKGIKIEIKKDTLIELN